MNTALVCIAKNEDHYIDEWIQYHLKLGFSKVFVYQNNWRYTGDKTQYRGAVNWIEFDGEVMQLKAYNDFIDKHYAEYDFAAFFDVDEFLCLKKDKSLDGFLSRYVDEAGVGVNWKVFGDSGLACVEGNNYSVLNRFTRCASTFNRHIKTILNLKLSKNTMHFINPHYVDKAKAFNAVVDIDKTTFIHGPWHDGCKSETAQLNHYHTKTWQEFQDKINRGRADTHLRTYNKSSFDQHNFNEIEDTTARDFFNRDIL